MNVIPDIKQLYEQHREALLRLALRLLGDEEESRDVVSDVFARLAEGTHASRAPSSRASSLCSSTALTSSDNSRTSPAQ